MKKFSERIKLFERNEHNILDSFKEGMLVVYQGDIYQIFKHTISTHHHPGLYMIPRGNTKKDVSISLESNYEKVLILAKDSKSFDNHRGPRTPYVTEFNQFNFGGKINDNIGGYTINVAEGAPIILSRIYPDGDDIYFYAYFELDLTYVSKISGYRTKQEAIKDGWKL